MWYDTLRFTIHTPDLAIVRFVVEDYDKTSKNDFVGQYTLPFSCMQQGKAEQDAWVTLKLLPQTLSLCIEPLLLYKLSV